MNIQKTVIRPLRKKRNQDILILTLAAAVLVAISLILLPYYVQAINPDGVAYLEIAKQYALGNIGHAVNGYWSPLTSWLLIPFVWLKIDLQVGYRILAILSSLAALVAVWIIAKQSLNKWYVKASIMAVAVFMILEWSLAGPITGDLLSLTVGLWLVVTFTNYAKKQSWQNIVLLALNGALFYYAKSIGLFVFLGILGVCMILEFRKAKISSVLKRYALVGALFALFVIPFIGAISYKYKTPTVSTAGKINFYLAAQYSADTNNYSHPATVSGPYTPPPEDVTIWQDPTIFTEQMSRMHQETDPANIRDNYIHSLLQNLTALFKGIPAVALALGFTGLYLLYRKQRTIATVLAVGSILTLAGYVLTYFEVRYVYFVSVALLIGITAVVNALPRKVALLGSILLLLLVIQPIQQLAEQASSGNSLHSDALQVAAVIPPRANVLSDDPSAIYYCYYGQFRCHSTVRDINNLDEYIQKNDIQYFLLSNVRDIMAQPDFWETIEQYNLTIVSPKGTILTQ